MDEVALAVENTVHCIGEIPADLAHPQAVRITSNTADLHLTSGELDEEQHEVALQSLCVHTSTVKKSAATIRLSAVAETPSRSFSSPALALVQFRDSSEYWQSCLARFDIPASKVRRVYAG